MKTSQVLVAATFVAVGVSTPIDYGCLHADAWLVNYDKHYSTIYKSVVEVQSSFFVSNSSSTGVSRRRLAGSPSATPGGSPPPMGGGGGVPPPTVGGGGGSPPPMSGSAGSQQPTSGSASESTGSHSSGWQVKFSGIPDYNHTMTVSEISTLNSRPKKSTDFKTGVTTATVGERVVFGQDIGYSSTACTEGYWPPGPGCPEAYNGTYVFPIHPAPEMTEGGCYIGNTLGYLVNGVPFWNWADMNSYNSEGVWNNLAGKFEQTFDMDICGGHSAQGVYHHHAYPPCLASRLGDSGTAHSPIYGFAYDGYPIYGPYQASGVVATSCWQARNYAANSPTGCSDGTRSCQLKDQYDYSQGTTSVSAGPSLTGTVSTLSGNTLSSASGIYYEDFFWNSSCSARGGQYLDSHNGHDHGDLGYHYHFSVDASLVPTFPYTMGPKYYGCVKGSACSTTYITSVGGGGGGGGSGPRKLTSSTSQCGVTVSTSSTACPASFKSPTLAPTRSMSPVRSPSRTPTVASSHAPSAATSAAPSTVGPTLEPTAAPVRIDYEAIHESAWVVPDEPHFNSIYHSDTGLKSSGYVDNSRRLSSDSAATPQESLSLRGQRMMQTIRGAVPTPATTARRLVGPPPGSPPPMGGGGPGGSNMPVAGGSDNGGGGGFDFAPTSTVGWQVEFTGIPDYDHTFTASEISTLNSRPNKHTDFVTNNATTATVGQYVVFGQDIGYAHDSCADGYFPPGPGCPEAYNGSYIYSITPAPEISDDGCYIGGKVGFFVNGVPFWSWTDGHSYQDASVWNDLAGAFEARYDMDVCRGHAAEGVYHHHTYSPCLASNLNDVGSSHSPVYGFAYDSYPIYGPYQSANTLAVSCWQTRDYAATSPTGCSNGDRSCQLKDPYDYSQGTTSVTAGPSITSILPEHNPLAAVSGIYFEDYFWNSSCSARGDQYLDSHNGHSHGSIGYHYHLTVDSDMVPVFPFTVGPKFYGCQKDATCYSSYKIQYGTTTSQCGTSQALAAAPSSTPSSSPSSGAALSTGAIIGIAVGGFVAVVAVCYVVYMALCATPKVIATGAVAGGSAAAASAPLEVAMTAPVNAQPVVPIGKNGAVL